MSARDVIREGIIKETGASLATVRADAAIAALTAAGYRILAPGEIDKETVDACAKVAERHANRTDYDLEPEAAVAENVTVKQIATAIRALGSRP